MFLKNRNIISKMKRSKVTDYAALKEGNMRISVLIFIYTVHFGYLKLYTKLKNTIGAKKSVTEISIGEKEK